MHVIIKIYFGTQLTNKLHNDDKDMIYCLMLQSYFYLHNPPFQFSRAQTLTCWLSVCLCTYKHDACNISLATKLCRPTQYGWVSESTEDVVISKVSTLLSRKEQNITD